MNREDKDRIIEETPDLGRLFNIMNDYLVEWGFNPDGKAWGLRLRIFLDLLEWKIDELKRVK